MNVNKGLFVIYCCGHGRAADRNKHTQEMKASLFLSALASTLAVVYAYNENPSVNSPKNMTYNAGMKIPITWSKATTGFVNIDLTNIYRNVLEQPYSIAVGVPAESGKFDWEIPADLKTAVGYQVRVWGAYQPKIIDNTGNSALFTIFNDIPGAVNNFIVTSPKKGNPCRVGEACEITWDYPKTINGPKDVDIVLYQVGNPVPLQKLATVSAADKKFVWEVPADSQLLKTGNVFISVDGSGVPHEAPKMASNMGANSEAFAISTPLPKIEDTPEYKAKKEQEEKEKAEKEAKEQEEAEKEEAEKKAKEEEEEQKKREEELNKKQRTKAKNAGSVNQVAVSAAVLCAMVAFLPFF